MKKTILLSSILFFNYAQASGQELFDEKCTISYQAAQIKGSQNNGEIPIIVNNSVSAVFDAYKPLFDEAIRTAKSDAGRRGIRGGAMVALITDQVYPFIDIIINQIDVVAQKLSPDERQQFWLHAEKSVSKRLENYSISKGGDTGNIAYRVGTLVRMKKIIG